MDGQDFSSSSESAPVNPTQQQPQRRYYCFCIPSSAPSSWWHKIRTRGVGAVNKIREWSELVAGPRWKTFIRRFNRTKRSGSLGKNLQYDPLSYAMNFDEGPGQNGNFDQDEEDGYFTRNFSSRYAKGYLDSSRSGGGGAGAGSTSV